MPDERGNRIELDVGWKTRLVPGKTWTVYSKSFGTLFAGTDMSFFPRDESDLAAMQRRRVERLQLELHGRPRKVAEPSVECQPAIELSDEQWQNEQRHKAEQPARHDDEL